jgi:hypothetical protein
MTDSQQGNKPRETAEEKDAVLGSILREWRVPDPSRGLDERVLDSYRGKVHARPLWQRFFFASVRVPLPVAALAMALIFIAAAVAIRRQPVATTVPPAIMGTDGLQASHAEPPVVIHTSLEGFQPVADINVTVMEEHRK